MNKVLILAGGPSINESYLRDIVGTFDKILCADSGADYAYRIGVIPDIVFGDLDSISGKALSYMNNHDVEIDVFPVEKDMTDSELCLSFVTKEYDPEKIVIVSSFKGRFDQLASNIQMAVKLCSPELDVIITDGNTFVYPLCDGLTRKVMLRGKADISVIPVSDPMVTGECSGLYYDLSNLTLNYGSSLSVSNKPAKGSNNIMVSCKTGRGYLVISY